MSAGLGEPLLTLTPRERALLTPHFAAIAGAEQVIAREQECIAQLVRMRAQRDDVMLDPATGNVYAAPAADIGPHGVSASAAVPPRPEVATALNGGQDEDDGN